MSDKSGHSVLVALMKENPLRGLSFHAAKVNTDFLLGAATLSPLSLSVFVSLLVIQPPCEILRLAHCILILSLTVSFGLFLLLSLAPFAEGASILILEWTIHNDHGGMKGTSQTINSPLESVLNQNFISTVDCISDSGISVPVSINDPRSFHRIALFTASVCQM